MWHTDIATYYDGASAEGIYSIEGQNFDHELRIGELRREYWLH